MTDEDFDDNFDDEFEEFNEEGSSDKGTASNASSPVQKSGGSNMKVIAISALIVLVVSYFGFDWISKATEPKPMETVTPPAPEAAPFVDSVSQNNGTTLPEPTEAPQETQETVAIPPATPPASLDDVAIDFSQEVTQVTPQPKEAVGNTKTFEQVQKDLKTSKAPSNNTVPSEINATLDSISEEMTLNVKQIKQLETLITSMAGSIDQLNRTISAMDNRVLSLTETVDSLSQDLTNVKRIIIDEDLDLTAPATVKFSGKKETAGTTASAPTYTVHAIIPGRAWLKSTSGQIITVREGDKVGDYGTVAVIDAGNGLVRTSSGITFR